MMFPLVLAETCSCGADTQAVVVDKFSAAQAHRALEVWRREHRHEKPARPAVRIPLARRRA